MERWFDQPPESRLAAIKAPALCAAGDLDIVIPAENAALLADRVPGAWRALFPGGRHAFLAQYPGRLATLVQAFLNR